MNVFLRFSVFLVLVSSYYIMAADAHKSPSERAKRTLLVDQCAKGSETVCDPSVASSGDYLAGKMELMTEKDLALLKENFPPFERIAKDYAGFYDWTEKAKKEKEGNVKKEILALEKDMRKAAALAVELIDAETQKDQNQNEGPEKEKGLNGKRDAEPQRPADGSREQNAEDPTPEAELVSGPSPDKGSTDAKKEPAVKTPGAAKIFQPNFLQIRWLKVALNNLVAKTEFKRNLGSEFFTDEENIEALLARIKDGVVNFGDRLGLDIEGGYPISRTGAPLNTEDYKEFPDKKNGE